MNPRMSHQTSAALWLLAPEHSYGKVDSGTYGRGSLLSLQFLLKSFSCFSRGFPAGSDGLPAIQETRVPSLGWKDPLEEGMATHSSILAWRIPWTEEPGGLRGSQRVGHD